MFVEKTYRLRRQRLQEKLDRGLVLLLGNADSAFNSAGNCYPFRQDSSFLYFCGLDQPHLALLLDVETGRELLCGPTRTLEEQVWSGEETSLLQLAERAGIKEAVSLETMAGLLQVARQQGRPVHYLPSCRAENLLTLGRLLNLAPAEAAGQTSAELIAAVVALRSLKSAEEVAELDSAAELGAELHLAAMSMAQAGVYEWQIAGELAAIAARAGRLLSFSPVVSVRGEVLHNQRRDRQLQDGDLLLVDAGVESARHYASDHTRTLPVGGRFSDRQRDIYAIVLSGMERARELIRPGIAYQQVHLEVCRCLADGLRQLGLMRGSVDDAVAAGAHALFMPHGLGHMLGLDVHDMEDLGEDAVGYDDSFQRSVQFGTDRLRLGRELKQGFALTVEPGLYFIPGLIERWQTDRVCSEFIQYSEVKKYLGFGGIRLEDDILVTSTGNRLLGPPLPLEAAAVEQKVAAG